MNVTCHSCGQVNQSLSKIGFRDECMKCKTDLHACKNCEFYDPKSYNECREPSADVVREKDRANYCDFYSPSQGGQKKGNEKDKLMAAAEALFKKK